jgi:hypothetical protein
MELTMTRLKMTLLAAAALTAVAGSAHALDIGDWMRGPDVAYVYTQDGKTMSVHMNKPDHGMMMRGAHKVPRNTMFFMVDGELYMRTGNMYDNSGYFMGSQS